MSERKLLVGLTGSIGMGKSTTAKMFAARGVPMWDADAAVHRIYQPGGGGADALRELFPQAIDQSGAVDRTILRGIVKGSADALKQIEARIHPLVQLDREAFRTDSDAPILLFDIPLLFETGADRWLDVVITVSVAPDIQQERVLERPGMDLAQFRRIMANQMPDAEKRARADYVIETSTMEQAEAQVDEILAELRSRTQNA